MNPVTAEGAAVAPAQCRHELRLLASIEPLFAQEAARTVGLRAITRPAVSRAATSTGGKPSNRCRGAGRRRRNRRGRSPGLGIQEGWRKASDRLPALTPPVPRSGDSAGAGPAVSAVARWRSERQALGSCGPPATGIAGFSIRLAPLLRWRQGVPSLAR